MLYSSIDKWSHTPIASAPPEPPSPITYDKIGTDKFDISKRLFAIASLCPLSSASMPGYAPGVSTNVMIGILNLSASFMTLKAFLKPSGLAMPKFLLILSLVPLPF